MTAGSWKISGTAVTPTAAEVNHLGGVTSAIQTQLNAKAALGGSATQSFQASEVDLGDWTVTESGGVLYFANSGTNKMKLDASGNLTVVGDIVAFGTM